MPTTIDRLLKNVSLKKKTPMYGYVAVFPAQNHANTLSRWLRQVCKINFAVTAKDFHVTLMYDRRNAIKQKAGRSPKKGKLFSAKVVNVEVFFPKGNEGAAVLVLLLDSKALTERHKQLRAMGFKHSYKEYKPHITLKTHSVSRSDLASASANLIELIDMLPTIMLYREAWEPIND